MLDRACAATLCRHGGTMHGAGRVAIALSFFAAGCAADHLRPEDAGPTTRRGCTPGAIMRCFGCTPDDTDGCCQRWCRWDATWDDCTFVRNACHDTAVSDGGR